MSTGNHLNLSRIYIKTIKLQSASVVPEIDSLGRDRPLKERAAFHPENKRGKQITESPGRLAHLNCSRASVISAPRSLVRGIRIPPQPFPPSGDTGSPKVCANPGWRPGKARPRCPSSAPCPHLPPSRDLGWTPTLVRSHSLSSHYSRDPRSWHQLGACLPSLPSPRLSFPRPRSAPEAPASFLRLHRHWPTRTLNPPPPPPRGPPPVALASRPAPASLTERRRPFQSSRLLASTPEC